MTVWPIHWERLAGDRHGPSWPGLFGREHPVNARACAVACALPGGDLGLEHLRLADTPIQTLAFQNTDLDLHHIEPTGVLWSVVELQAAQDAAGLRGRGRLAKRRWGGGRQ